MTQQSPSDKPTTPNMGFLASREPAKEIKGYIRNLILYEDSEQGGILDTMDFWWRPSNVRENGSVNYKQTEVIGMSHKYRNFSSTNNFNFTFDVYFNSLMRLKTYSGEKRKGQLKIYGDEIQAKRRFIEALTIPYETQYGEFGSENPPCILVIPGIVGMKCKLDSFDFEFRDCTLHGDIKELMCQLSFTEEPEQRVTMRDHLATGMERTWGKA